MSPTLRRARGLLLRVAYRRTSALLAGGMLLLPAGVLLAGDFGWESGVSDGVGLLSGATGAALLVVGFGGRRGDWVE